MRAVANARSDRPAAPIGDAPEGRSLTRAPRVESARLRRRTRRDRSRPSEEEERKQVHGVRDIQARVVVRIPGVRTSRRLEVPQEEVPEDRNGIGDVRAAAVVGIPAMELCPLASVGDAVLVPVLLPPKNRCRAAILPQRGLSRAPFSPPGGARPSTPGCPSRAPFRGRGRRSRSSRSARTGFCYQRFEAQETHHNSSGSNFTPSALAAFRSSVSSEPSGTPSRIASSR